MIFIGFDYKNEDIKWKKIYWLNGEETKYSISNIGLVRNDERNRLLKNIINHDGYIRVGLTHNGKQRYFYMHRLVATAFIPNPENKPEVNHINGIKSCNYDYNLEWVTASENIQHAFDTGLNNGSNRIRTGRAPEHIIRSICELLESGTDLTFVQIGERFGVGRNLVSSIYHRESQQKISKDYDFSKYEIKTDFSKSGDLSEKTIYPDALIHLVCQMIDSGKYSLPEIAEKTAVNYQTVRNVYYGTCRHSISSQYNFSKTDKNPLMEDKKRKIIEACELFDKGYNTKEVAVRLELPRSLVRNLYTGNTWVEIAKDYEFYKTKDQRKKHHK